MKLKNWIWQSSIHIILAIVSMACILPFMLLFTSSITDEQEIYRNGYALFPQKISFAAYSYLLHDAEKITQSIGVTLIITLVGTLIGLILIALLAYPLSRKHLPGRNYWAFFVFFTMLFNGGLVPTYLVYTQLFDMKNSIWALIVPGLLLNAFYVMLMRTFFATSIPEPVIESAKIDGAGDFGTFIKIVLPLSLPILATVGLFQTINYWNDWFNGMIYITDSRLFSLQNLLNRILLDIQFLASSNFGSQADVTTNAPMETVRMAMAVIGVVPILAAYPFFQKYFVKGLTVGAVKG
ncbi:carbohydrate ABC transporter permease [Paenibacillus sp. GM2]|uniref:carbohydrate ABC transporter permease n=1 Tax=Paenibacillus sp. GM2 TaxID=1622070 RepID=UPI000A9E9C91|nr:carbohydrate ABC transporter permease [Paenibacillus sp. GM2]